MKSNSNNTRAAAEEPKTAQQLDPATAVLDGSELGEIKIHENVAALLVRRAALGVDGVSRLAGNALVDNIAEFVGSRRMQSRAITVELEDNNRVGIEVKLNLKFGYNIPETAQKVQHAVIEEVEKVTGMTVTKVNVVIQELEDPAPAESDTDGKDDVPPREMPLN